MICFRTKETISYVLLCSAGATAFKKNVGSLKLKNKHK